MKAFRFVFSLLAAIAILLVVALHQQWIYLHDGNPSLKADISQLQQEMKVLKDEVLQSRVDLQEEIMMVQQDMNSLLRQRL